MRYGMKKLYLYAILLILIIPKDANAGWVSVMFQQMIDYASSIFKKIPNEILDDIETPSSDFKLTNEDLNTIIDSVRGGRILNQFNNQEKDDKENLEKDGLLLNSEETNLDNVIINKEINFK